jgi:hypothetical protein
MGESAPDVFRQATNPAKMWVDHVNGADQSVNFGCRYANLLGRELGSSVGILFY